MLFVNFPWKLRQWVGNNGTFIYQYMAEASHFHPFSPDYALNMYAPGDAVDGLHTEEFTITQYPRLARTAAEGLPIIWT